MRLVFVHTAEKVKTDSRGNFYTDGAYDNSVWPRYLRICDSLVFIARRDPRMYDDELLREKYNRIDSTRMEVVLIDDTRDSLRGFIDIQKRIKNRAMIRDVIAQADKMIVRLPCAEGITAIQVARSKGLDYLVECVGCAWDSLWNYNLKGKVLALPSYVLMRWGIARAGFVLYVTHTFLQKRYPTRGRTIGCSDVALEAGGGAILNRRELRIAERVHEPLVIGTLGAIDVRYKGHADVIAALASIHKQGYDYRYQLVGGGSSERLYQIARELGVDDRVEFLGSLKHEEVFAWLDAIDIYIQPSKIEGIPRALLEAMSRACPALGSNVGGIPEALEPDAVFKQGDINAISSALMRTSDQDVMRVHATRNFEKSKEYQSDVLKRRRDDFFDEFIHR